MGRDGNSLTGSGLEHVDVGDGEKLLDLRKSWERSGR